MEEGGKEDGKKNSGIKATGDNWVRVEDGR